MMNRKKPNAELREYAKNKRVYLYEVANVYGITSNGLNARMHKPFTEDEAAEFREIVDRIADGLEDDEEQEETA